MLGGKNLETIYIPCKCLEMGTWLIVYPYKVIMTWFRTVAKPKPEKAGLRGPTGHSSLLVKSFNYIYTIEGWPPWVLGLPGVMWHWQQFCTYCRGGPRSNWTNSLDFTHSNVFFKHSHFWEGYPSEPRKGQRQLGLSNQEWNLKLGPLSETIANESRDYCNSWNIFATNSLVLKTILNLDFLWQLGDTCLLRLMHLFTEDPAIFEEKKIVYFV